MPRKKKEEEEGLVEETPKAKEGLVELLIDFARTDLNALRDKLNEVIRRLN